MRLSEKDENKKASMRNHFYLLSIMLFLMGCTLSPKKQFEQVRVGMEKDQVLGIMDSPQRTQRWHGMDRWTYIFYEDDSRFEKEVHFQNGYANYVGDVFKPEVSADEQDLRNDDANKEVEAMAQAHREEVKKAFPAYEDKVRGTNEYLYVPQFTPVQ